ncbi:MAG: galactose ABC transporter substrate-binding protein [Wujia sp.]
MNHGIKRYFVLLLVMVVVLCGCGKQDVEKRTTMRVGVVLYTQDDPFINALTDCLKKDFESMESNGLKIIMTVRDGRDDQSVQDDVVEEMIDAGCDVLCVDLVDRTAPSKIIEMAKKEDIPIIFFNREPVREDLMQWEKMYYVGGDAQQSGVMQGEIAADAISADKQVDRNQDGKIQYVLLEGQAGHQDAIIRTDCAVRTLIDEGIELEKLSYQFADWNRAQAENKMTQLINQYGDDIELVLANNDEMAIGAVAAYDRLEYDADRRPIIFGIDGLQDVLTAVEEGTIQGTVYNDKEGQALQMANLAVDLFEGNSLAEYDFQDEKYIILSYQKVDSSNVADYIGEK